MTLLSTQAWALHSSLLCSSPRILGEQGHELPSPTPSVWTTQAASPQASLGPQSRSHFPLCTVGPRGHSASLRNLRACGLQNRAVTSCAANPESAHGRTRCHRLSTDFIRPASLQPMGSAHHLPGSHKCFHTLAPGTQQQQGQRVPVQPGTSIPAVR